MAAVVVKTSDLDQIHSNFSFLGPTVPELLKKGEAALLKYAMSF